MGKLTCDLCGGSDFMKDGGVFVCQSCGCKYSMEEVRRMMAGELAPVAEKVVKVDNSDFVQKYLENARRAKQKEDWEETEKYYNLVEQNDPNNIEAIFYSAYGKAKASLVDDDIYKRQAVFKVLTNCISLLDDKYRAERRDENREILVQIAADIGEMICSNFVYTEWKNGYGVVTRTNKTETYTLFGGLLDAFRETIANITAIDDQVYIREATIALYRTAQQTGIGNWHSLMTQWINEEAAALKHLHQKAAMTYWAEHPEEKRALEERRDSLNAQIAQYNAQINNSPERAAVRQLEQQIQSLMFRRDSLGMFKGKEKKELQDQIDRLQMSLHTAMQNKNRMEQNLGAMIQSLQREIASIYEQLNSAH